MERIRNISFVLLLGLFLWTQPVALGASYDCESLTYGYGFPLVHDDGDCGDAEAACTVACWECYEIEDTGDSFGCEEHEYPAGGTWFHSFCDCHVPAPRN